MMTEDQDTVDKTLEQLMAEARHHHEKMEYHQAKTQSDQKKTQYHHAKMGEVLQLVAERLQTASSTKQAHPTPISTRRTSSTPASSKILNKTTTKFAKDPNNRSLWRNWAPLVEIEEGKKYSMRVRGGLIGAILGHGGGRRERIERETSAVLEFNGRNGDMTREILIYAGTPEIKEAAYYRLLEEMNYVGRRRENDPEKLDASPQTVSPTTPGEEWMRDW